METVAVKIEKQNIEDKKIYIFTILFTLLYTELVVPG